MPFIFIDRRKAGKGKSTPNRQKLLKRVRSFIKTAQPKNIGQGGVTGSGAKPTSPVKVTGSALEEPRFAYAKGGEQTIIIIGNDEYDRGDDIEIPDEDGGGSGGAGQGDSGEDDFIVNVAKDEFLDLFFEDCELPNLTNEKFTERLDNTQQPAGFSTTGNPAQLSIIRTYKQSLGRRWALMRPYKDELEELEQELEKLDEILAGNPLNSVANLRRKEITDRIEAIHAKIAFLNGFDKSDLRFRKKEAKPLKTVDAVLIMVMDISGSMDADKKTIARRWFALLYAFIMRRYKNTELVFIAHTDEAFEMSENEFFTTRVNGGTKVSSAIKLVNDIIKERYDASQTNIYVSHASDGDNWDNDNEVVIDEMLSTSGLMGKIQLFSYVEVGKQLSSNWYSQHSKANTNLWDTYDDVRLKLAKNKLVLAIIETADDCYGVFKNVFKKEK
jgi:uncharacterized sporulation protein YeaH/YhbH (DUF444 family)